MFYRTTKLLTICERWPFVFRNAVNYTLKCRLLEGKRRHFAKSLNISELQSDKNKGGQRCLVRSLPAAYHGD